jgi:sugar phosphate permease|tara:strand:+ start:5298 stop:6593 length:1296 start_codon:yes stop_codon:yes gene_type:complete
MSLTLKIRQNISDIDFKHYGWVIVAVGAVAQMIGSAIRMAFGIIIDPLVEEFSWDPKSIGIAYAIMSIVTAFSSPIAGYCSMKIGARKTMYIGLILFLIGMIWTALATTIFEFYISYGVIFGFAQSLFLVPVIPAVAIWFKKRLGLATGLIIGMWSLGPAIVIQLMGIMLDSLGWQQTFIISGIVGTIIMVIALQFFRNTPQEINLLPYGATNNDKLDNNEEIITENNHSLNLQKIVYNTNGFWSLMNIHFLGCVGHAVILIGLVPLMISKGISYTDSVMCLTIIMIVSISTRFLTPILGDTINPKIIMFLSFLGQGLFVIPWMFTEDKWMFYLVGMLWAIPYGGEGTLFPLMNRKYYGFFRMDTTYGWQILAASLGMALGGFIPGLVFDVTGGYEYAILISAFFSILGAFVILTLETTKKVLRPSFENLG